MLVFAVLAWHSKRKLKLVMNNSNVLLLGKETQPKKIQGIVVLSSRELNKMRRTRTQKTAKYGKSRQYAVEGIGIGHW